MATVTSRLGIIKPAYNESADVGTINQAMDIVDGTAGLIVCTEATKPTLHLFEGMYIKCTDSGKHYLYIGGTWIEDFYGIISIITLTGSGAVFYGARMSRPYSFGATNGDHTPSISAPIGDYLIDAADSGVNTGDGRGLVTNIAVATATKGLVKFSAYVGSGTAYPTAYPLNASLYGPYTSDKFAPLRFDLYKSGVYLCTVARAIPQAPSLGVIYGVQLNAEVIVDIPAGSTAFGIRAHLEGAQDGTIGRYQVVHEASFTVTLSA